MATKWGIVGITSLAISAHWTSQHRNELAKFMWPQIPSTAVPYPKFSFLFPRGRAPPGNHTMGGFYAFPLACILGFVLYRPTLGFIMHRLLQLRYLLRSPRLGVHLSPSKTFEAYSPRIFVNTFGLAIIIPISRLFSIFRDGPGKQYDPEFYRTKKWQPRPVLAETEYTRKIPDGYNFGFISNAITEGKGDQLLSPLDSPIPSGASPMEAYPSYYRSLLLKHYPDLLIEPEPSHAFHQPFMIEHPDGGVEASKYGVDHTKVAFSTFIQYKRALALNQAEIENTYNLSPFPDETIEQREQRIIKLMDKGYLASKQLDRQHATEIVNDPSFKRISRHQARYDHIFSDASLLPVHLKPENLPTIEEAKRINDSTNSNYNRFLWVPPTTLVTPNDQRYRMAASPIVDRVVGKHHFIGATDQDIELMNKKRAKEGLPLLPLPSTLKPERIGYGKPEYNPYHPSPHRTNPTYAPDDYFDGILDIDAQTRRIQVIGSDVPGATRPRHPTPSEVIHEELKEKAKLLGQPEPKYQPESSIPQPLASVPISSGPTGMYNTRIPSNDILPSSHPQNTVSEPALSPSSLSSSSSEPGLSPYLDDIYFENYPTDRSELSLDMTAFTRKKKPTPNADANTNANMQPRSTPQNRSKQGRDGGPPSLPKSF